MPLRSLLALLAVVLGLGVAPAGAAPEAATASELVVTRDSVIVGDFAGYGGQLNQHVYANISGPPPAPRGDGVEGGGSPPAARPHLLQHERVDEPRPHGVVRAHGGAGRARERGDQHHLAGQHVRVRHAEHGALRRRARRAPRAARYRAPLGDDVQRAEHDRPHARAVRAGLPVPAPPPRGARRARAHPVHGRRPHALGTRALPGRLAPVHGEPHGRPAGRLVGARVLGLLGHAEDRRTAAARGPSHREHDPGRAAPAALRHRVRRARPRDVRGRGELRAGLLARRGRGCRRAYIERVPARVVRHPLRAARRTRAR